MPSNASVPTLVTPSAPPGDTPSGPVITAQPTGDLIGLAITEQPKSADSETRAHDINIDINVTLNPTSALLEQNMEEEQNEEEQKKKKRKDSDACDCFDDGVDPFCCYWLIRGIFDCCANVGLCCLQCCEGVGECCEGVCECCGSCCEACDVCGCDCDCSD